MAQPVRPKPSFPQLNRSHPLTQGLVFDVPLFEGSGPNVIEIIGALLGTGSNTISWISDFIGYVLSFAGEAVSGRLLSFTTNPNVNSQSLMSWEGYLYCKGSGGGTNGRFLHKKNGATRWKIQMASSNTVMDFAIDCTTTAPDWTWNINNNVWFHLVVTYDDTQNANVPKVYINGQPVTVTTITARTEARIADDTNLYLGNYQTAAKTWNGYIAYARIWNRLLSAQEVSALYADPFQIYKKKTWSLKQAVTVPTTNLLSLLGAG